MAVTNGEVAEILRRMGELLEIRGEGGPFRSRAYLRAAETIRRLDRPVTALSEDELVRLPSVGTNIAAKIAELSRTGSIHEYEELKSTTPSSLVELLNLDGVGPKTVHILWKKMGITGIEELEHAARGHRLRALKGFGAKRESDILEAIAGARQMTGRMNRIEAGRIISRVRAALEGEEVIVAGSCRRKKSTIGDIDLVTSAPPRVVTPRLRAIADEVIDEGERRFSFRTMGRRVDLRFARQDELGSMLMYLTGSKAFNVKIRSLAMTRQMKLNEYGIEELVSGAFHRFGSESEIFAFLRMQPVPPELREDTGEVERALAGTLPALVTDADIRGDLHCHSTWSDGTLSLHELAAAGEARGYEYLLVSDHSASLGVARGLDANGLRDQHHAIEVENRRGNCRLLHGIEVDILADGTLGLPSAVLRDLDVVIASVHSAFRQERDVVTRRVIRAIENDAVDIIGHPTGRMIGQRAPLALDMARMLEAARDTGTALEINASPYRLDLDDIYVRQAIEMGVKVVIGTDAHGMDDFSWMGHGVGIARRGWCTAADVLNTRPLSALREQWS